MVKLNLTKKILHVTIHVVVMSYLTIFLKQNKAYCAHRAQKYTY